MSGIAAGIHASRAQRGQNAGQSKAVAVDSTRDECFFGGLYWPFRPVSPVHLDVSSLLIAYAAHALSVSIAILFIRSAVPAMPGPGWWAASFACAAAGNLLLGLSGHIPDGLVILAGNTLSVAAPVCLWIGLARTGGQHASRGIGFAAVLVFAAVHAWFWLGDPDPAARMLNRFGFLIGATAAATMALIRSDSIARGMATRFVIVAMLAQIVTYLAPMAAIAWAGWGDALRATNPSIPVRLEGLTFVASFVTAMALALGFILMIGERLRQELNDLATRDALTGVDNRRAVLAFLDKVIDRAPRGPVSVMMADIDHFKRVNDRFGHQAGDQVLTAFAQVLARGLRPGDQIGRYGGEEFLIVLPRTGAEDARAVAERFRATVEAMRVDLSDGSEPLAITVSIGVATLGPDNLIGPADLIGQADDALYLAKNAGRNRVEAT